MRKSLVSLLLCGLFFTAGAIGCSDDTDDTPEILHVDQYILANDSVEGWTGDGPESASTDEDIEAIINGHHAPYADEGTTGFVIEEYTNGELAVTIEIWEMNGATNATNMFTYNKAEGESSDGLAFEDVSNAGTAAIIADDQPTWKVFAHKGPYIVALNLNFPATNTDSKDAAKTAAIALIQAQMAALP